MTPSITQDDINTALGNFLTAILNLPQANIIVGQVNRVASPEGDFVVMWPLRRPRLATNVDTPEDAVFTGSISGTTLDITAVDPDFSGQIKIGSQTFGVGVAANTMVTELGSGTGGVGTYTVTPSQDVPSETLSAGTIAIEQTTEAVMQVDVHGPASADNAETIATLFRDAYGVSLFEGTGITPLYTDEPRQMPFITAANQYEDRWTVDVHMQVDPTISVPQQFASQATVNVVDVTATYPAD